MLVFAIWSNGYVYAQQSSSTSPSSASMPSSPSVAKVKITSPSKGQQVPVGKDLTVYGTSIDNATSNNDCKVSVIANKVRPYQPATATGTGGAADYSKWKFEITSKYTAIKPGPNRVTAKYECANNAALTSFSSVNATGVQQRTGTTAGTIATNKSTTTTPTATTTSSTAAKTQISSSSSRPQQTTTPKLTTTSAASVAAAPKQQQIVSTTNTNNTVSLTTNAATGISMAPVSNPTTNASSSPLLSIAPQIKAVNQQQPRLPPIRGINSTTAINSIAPQVKAVDEEQQQQTLAPSQITPINVTAGQNDAFVATPPAAPSGKLLYLGYHGGGSTPTNEDNSPNYKSSSDSKPPSIHRSSSTTSDNDSTGKKEKTSSTNEDSSPNDKSSSDSKSPTPHTKISATDNDSAEEKKTSTTKLDRADSTNSTNGESSSKKDKRSSSSSDSRSSRSTNDGIESSPSSSDFVSPTRNKVDPIIRNPHSLFGFSDYDGF
jgi:hypothetical protein